MTKERKQRMAVTFLLITALFLFLPTINLVAHAAGLVDDTIDAANEYSRYPLDNYQLDFYVDTSWDWLPWNWKDGIGNSVMYGLYLLTNVIWTGSLYISNATGYVVQEAYSLDFISDMADTIGKNMQTLAGVSTGGISSQGFYIGFLLLFLLIIGIYVAYMGLIKRETTKAIGAVVNFVLVFLLSGAFIAYAPAYIGKINDFSSDISNAALTLGTKVSMPESQAHGKDSVDLIRDSLFNIQVMQPWQLLQYGTTDVGKARMEKLVSVSPDLNSGEDREAVVKEEIENQENTNLSLPKVATRLGMVLFLFVFNLGISIFVFLLSGIMIFSQILFIIYAMFLPISFLLGMLPTYNGIIKKAVEKVFNTIMMRAGITLVITVAFSISTMFYAMSDGYPFFMTAFLQIVTFAGIYMKLGDIMGMFHLNGSSDARQMGRTMFRYPNQMRRRMSYRMGRVVSTGVAGAAGAVVGGFAARKNTGGVSRNQSIGQETGTRKRANTGSTPGAARLNASGKGKQTRWQQEQADSLNPAGKQVRQTRPNIGQRVGKKAGTVLDMKKRIRDNAGNLKDQVKNTPTNMRYAAYAAKKAAKDKVNQNLEGFKDTLTATREKKAANRAGKADQRRQTLADKRRALEQEQTKKNARKDRMRKDGSENTRKNIGPILAERKQIPETDKKKITRPNIQNASFSQYQGKGKKESQETRAADQNRASARTEPLINGVPLSQSRDAATWTGKRQEKRGEKRNQQKGRFENGRKRG